MRKILFLGLICFLSKVSFSQITLSIATQSPWCYGYSGSATVTATGGTPGYTYLWQPTGNTTDEISGMPAGDYTVYVQDAASNTASATASITQPAQLGGWITTYDIFCTGSCNGSASASPSGGTPPFTIMWEDGTYGYTNNNLCPGPSFCTITDSYLCSYTATFIINSIGTGSLTGVTPTLTTYNESCYLSKDGAIDLSLSGTHPGPFTYDWSNGATTQDITNLGTSSYSVIIYDSVMNCKVLTTSISYANSGCGTISGNLYLDNNSDCAQNSGDVNFSHSVIIANPGNRYAYPNAAGNYTFYAVPYGTYSVTTSGYPSVTTPTCATTLTTTVNAGSPNSNNKKFAFKNNSPTQPDMIVSANSSGIVPGFTGHVSYLLNNLSLFNGSGTFKATLPSSFIPNITSIYPATYTINGDTIIWNFSNINYSSYTSFSVQFTVPVSTPLGSTFTTCMWANTTATDFNPANNTSCFSQIVTGAYDPNDKGVNPIGTGPNGNIEISQNELTYLVRFQNTGNGPAVNIVVKDTISSNLDMSTFQMINASHAYAVDVLPGNIVRWKFNNIMLPDSGSNEPGSHGFIQYRIKQKATNTIGTQIKNTAYIYFDFNDPVITNTTLNTITASTSSSLTLSVNVQNSSCPGLCNGSASVTISGGVPAYTYTWSPAGASTYSYVTGLCPGTYTVIASDALNNTGSAVFTISSAPSLTATVTQTNVSCYGSCDGRATATINGGTSPYTLQWNPSGPNALCTGIYSLQVIDSQGCFTQQSFTITQPPLLTAIISTTNASCFGGNNGCASATLTGGTPAYTYNWSPTGPCGLTAGPYTFNGIDSKGCTVTQTFFITQPPQLMASITSTNITCNGACNGAMQANITNGTSPYYYLWSPVSATTQAISNLCPGSYSLFATDSHSCTANATQVIVEPPPVSYSLSSTAESCPGCCNGSIQVNNLQGGCSPYSIILNPGNIFSGSGIFTNLCSMVYTVSVQDACCGIAVSNTICVDFNCGIATSLNNYSTNEANNLLFNSSSNELEVATQTALLISDINGRIIIQTKTTDKNQKIDLSWLSNGIYIITIYQNDQTISKKKILKYQD